MLLAVLWYVTVVLRTVINKRTTQVARNCSPPFARATRAQQRMHASLESLATREFTVPMHRVQVLQQVNLFGDAQHHANQPHRDRAKGHGHGHGHRYGHQLLVLVPCALLRDPSANSLVDAEH